MQDAEDTEVTPALAGHQPAGDLPPAGEEAQAESGPASAGQQGRSPLRWVAVGALAIALLAGTAAGAFLGGQSTRKSEEVVRAETKATVAAAVEIAVTDAVEKKGAEDKAKRLKIMHRAAVRMKARHRVEIRKVRRVGERKAARAYSSGSAVGQQTGYAAGVDDGITKASDDLTCSDDPDVPLPYCFFD